MAAERGSTTRAWNGFSVMERRRIAAEIVFPTCWWLWFVVDKTCRRALGFMLARRRLRLRSTQCEEQADVESDDRDY